MRNSRSRIGLFMILTLLILAFSLTAAIAYAKPDKDVEKNVGDLEYLGMVTFETGTMFQGTEIGGLSGITYDASRGVYYVISDDVYQKIRLNRDNIVKAKEPAASEEGDEGS